MSVFKVRLSLLVLCLLPLLVGLGLWQLSRYQQKLELENRYLSRESLPPISLNALSQYEDPLYLPLSVRGQFYKDHYFLLDNQVYKGQAGYALIMPFQTEQGELILVNRGWVPAKTRDSLPGPFIDTRVYQLTGTVYRPLGEAFLLKDDLWADGWPKVIQAIDFVKASATLNKDLPSFLLNLNADQPGSLQVSQSRAVMSSDKHMGYAFQWFTMAAVLLVLYGFQIKIKEK